MASKHLIFAVALSFASLAMAPSDGVVLRKTLKSTTETYHMVSTTTQQISLPGGTGDQDLVSSSKATYTLKIGTVDASGDVSPAALTTKIEQYDVSGALADIIPSDREKYLKPSTTSGTIDSHNRFIADANAKEHPMAVINGSVNNTLAGLFIEFPDKPVKIGDTWDVTVRKGLITGQDDQKLTAKLVSEGDLDGKSIYKISLGGTIKTDINMADLVKNSDADDAGELGKLDLKIKGQVDFNGESTVDKATGQTISLSLKLTTKQNLKVSGLPITTTGSTTATMTLDK